MSKIRRKYTKEEKLEIVKLSFEDDQLGQKHLTFQMLDLFAKKHSFFAR